MTVASDFLSTFLPAFVLAAFVGYGMLVVLRKQRASRAQSRTDDDEVFINIAVCETKHGYKTHYHDIGSEGLNFGGYPLKGHPTLCGAEAAWDNQNQDQEATCETCREALAKYAREFDEAAK